MIQLLMSLTGGPLKYKATILTTILTITWATLGHAGVLVDGQRENIQPDRRPKVIISQISSKGDGYDIVVCDRPSSEGSYNNCFMLMAGSRDQLCSHFERHDIAGFYFGLTLGAIVSQGAPFLFASEAARITVKVATSIRSAGEAPEVLDRFYPIGGKEETAHLDLVGDNAIAAMEMIQPTADADPSIEKILETAEEGCNFKVLNTLRSVAERGGIYPLGDSVRELAQNIASVEDTLADNHNQKKYESLYASSSEFRGFDPHKAYYPPVIVIEQESGNFDISFDLSRDWPSYSDLRGYFAAKEKDLPYPGDRN